MKWHFTIHGASAIVKSAYSLNQYGWLVWARHARPRADMHRPYREGGLGCVGYPYLQIGLR